MGKYVTAAKVRETAGVEPADFGVDSDDELDALVERWVGHVEGILERDRRRDYKDDVDTGRLEAIPEGWEGVVERACAHLIAYLSRLRASRGMSLEDAAQHITGPTVLTPAVREELALYPSGRKGRPAGIGVLTVDPSRVGEDDEDDE